MNYKLAQQELERRKKPSKFILSAYLFDKQLAFVQDPSPFKIAVCSRRSGKTVSCAAHLIDTAINNKGVVCVYITLSRNNAKKIVWKELKELNRKYQLQGQVNQTELTLSFPNGSAIYLSGAKDVSEIEKFRGLAIKLCYIDEGQSFRAYLEALINDVIAPALMDYGGTLCLIGSPGAIPTGFFHSCASPDSTWSKHSWTYFDNPFIVQKSGQTHQALLDRELKRRGVSILDPSIQREWYGKWVLDSDSLLLRYKPEVNNYTSLPSNLIYILGIDLGFKDADALAVIGWSENEPTTYLVEEVVTAGQGLTELVQQIQALQKKYNISKMVIDEGGLGKKLAEEMRRRHHIPVHAAEKQRKMENIAFLNDALRTGRFRAKAGSRFAQDSYLVEIDRDKSTPDKIKVSSSYHSDIIDAVLYAFKESPAFSYTPPVEKPKQGSKEYYDNLTSELEQQAEDFFTAQELIQKDDPYGFDDR